MIWTLIILLHINKHCINNCLISSRDENELEDFLITIVSLNLLICSNDHPKGGEEKK